ncbi:MAG: hypothetical protein ISP79_06540 [Methylophilaceae bacterium]|nr:hypothetical protein [Methylophilaceae bacterium]
MKHDDNKIDVSLLPPSALLQVAKVMMLGTKKYDRNNWRNDKSVTWTRTYSSIQRHLLAWLDGEDKDRETGESHVAHAAAQCLMLMVLEKEQKQNDDRFKG